MSVVDRLGDERRERGMGRTLALGDDGLPRHFDALLVTLGLIFAVFCDDLLLDVAWNRTVASKFHGKSGFALSLGTQVSRVTEHFSQRNFRQNYGVIVTHVAAEQ